MSSNPSAPWTRRVLLRTIPAALVSSLFSSRLGAASVSGKPVPPFSHFLDVAQAAGLTETTVCGEQDSFTYIIESMATGCAFFDYDNDGWMDIFILSSRRLENTPTGATNRLYRNNRDSTFTDVTVKAGLVDIGWAQGVCVGDYNNDGFEDLFLTYYGQNRLYRNNGDGTFTNVTEKAGLLHPKTRYSSGCTFVDYNRDGLLDLFVANYLQIDLATAPKPSLMVANCNAENVPVNCGPNGLSKAQNYLYRNNGDGTFSDVSKESGVGALRNSYCLTATSVDVDEDGWPDIVVACDTSPSLLLMNNHDGTFREEALIRGIALSADGHQMGGMGLGVGDYNLDGHTDLVKTHFLDQATGIYSNDGKGNFEDQTTRAGLNKETRYVSFGPCLADLDNDGYPDILITTGSVYPELDRVSPKYALRTPTVLFRNRGNGTFVEVGAEAGPGIVARHCSRGLALGDFDNDGDLDVLIVNLNEPPSLLRNDLRGSHHWLKVKLVGTASNRGAIGARVLVRYGKKIQAQALVSQSSFYSSNDPRLHFGLGAETSADVEIHWPSGQKQELKGIKADQLVTVQEGKGIIPGKGWS